MTDSAPPPRIFFEPMKKFTPPLPNSTTDLLLSQVLHHLKCCYITALLDLTAAPKVKILLCLMKIIFQFFNLDLFMSTLVYVNKITILVFKSETLGNPGKKLQQH